jgi:hypothetical protein
MQTYPSTKVAFLTKAAVKCHWIKMKKYFSFQTDELYSHTVNTLNLSNQGTRNIILTSLHWLLQT